WSACARCAGASPYTALIGSNERYADASPLRPKNDPVQPARPPQLRPPLGRLEEALRGQSELLTFAGAALTVVALFACDYALPAEVRLHGLYVFPLAIAAHYCARLRWPLAVLLLSMALQCAGYALKVVASAAPLSDLGTQFATSVLILFIARAWR